MAKKAKFFLQQGPNGNLAEFQVILFNVHPMYNPRDLNQKDRCGFNFALALIELNKTKDYNAIPNDSLREPFAEEELHHITEWQMEDMDDHHFVISGYPLEFNEKDGEKANEEKR